MGLGLGQGAEGVHSLQPTVTWADLEALNLVGEVLFLKVKFSFRSVYWGNSVRRLDPIESTATGI